MTFEVEFDLCEPEDGEVNLFPQELAVVIGERKEELPELNLLVLVLFTGFVRGLLCERIIKVGQGDGLKVSHGRNSSIQLSLVHALGLREERV